MIATMTFGDRLWTGLRILGWLGVAAILIAPAIAMRFTTEVNWTQSDFVFAGILLIGGGAVVELYRFCDGRGGDCRRQLGHVDLSRQRQLS